MTTAPTNPRLEEMWTTIISREETLHGEVDAGRTILSRSALESFERQTAVGLLPKINPAGEDSEFVVSRTLGRGGMGIVRLARQNSLWRDVAIKTVLPDETGSQAAQDLLRESWVTGMLEHPNIVPVHALGLDEGGFPMLVMKRVEGISWETALNNPDLIPAPLRAGRDDLEAHLQILLQLTNALHFAHKHGIIHCDLKPENVMLGAFGEVYLLDWGIAVSLADDGTGRLPLARNVDDISGTPAFIAPELAGGEGEHIGPWTDTYLLGSVLHTIITGGEPRHKGDTVFSLLFNAYQSDPVEYGDDVPAELGEICNRATAKSTSRRYQSAEEFRDAIVAFLQHRDSQRLSDDGEKRLAELQGLGPDADLTTVDRLFTECRFAFEQALSIWPENRSARAGRLAALETMAAIEIDRRDASAASRHLEDHPSPPPELSSDLEALEADLQREAEENRKNEAIRRSVDLDLASPQRAKMSFFLGLLFGGVPFINHALIEAGIATMSFPAYFTQFAVIFTGAALVVFFMRERLLKNAINARIITSIFVILIGALIVRVVGFFLGLSPAGCIAMENALFSFAMFMMAVSLDRRLWPAGLAFLAGAIGGSIQLESILFWDGASNAAALWLIALAWRKPRGEHTLPFTLGARDDH